MPSLHLTEDQEALLSRAVEGLLAISDESARYSFLQQNPEIELHNVVLYLASQVPKIVDLPRSVM
jgi:hypothetical protein